MISSWEKVIQDVAQKELEKCSKIDDSHGYSHLCRVTNLAVQFAKEEKANELVVFAAAMLHDIISLPKTHPESHKSSQLAAARSEELLKSIEFPGDLIPDVSHAIAAHSFSANIPTKSIEAKCVQDADRMEALGAFGLMRVFYCCGMFGTDLLEPSDPEANKRPLNDKKYALDHFEKKLFSLYDTMKTESGKKIASSLSDFLKEFRSMLVDDLSKKEFLSPRFKLANIYKKAGEQGIALFHPTDPLSKNGRGLSSNDYALDSLLNEHDEYIRSFIKQLEYELNGYIFHHD